jgi:hypothetical protein
MTMVLFILLLRKSEKDLMYVCILIRNKQKPNEERVAHSVTKLPLFEFL